MREGVPGHFLASSVSTGKSRVAEVQTRLVLRTAVSDPFQFGAASVLQCEQLWTCTGAELGSVPIGGPISGTVGASRASSVRR